MITIIGHFVIIRKLSVKEGNAKEVKQNEELWTQIDLCSLSLNSIE